MKYELSKDQEKLILKITKKFKHAYFSGSFALNILGYIERPIGDIDICIPINYITSGVSFINYLKYGHSLFKLFNRIKPENNYIKTKIDGISMCVFFVDSHDCLEILYKNTRIKVSLPEDIMKAKVEYVTKYRKSYFTTSIRETMDKHKHDIEVYEKNKLRVERLIKIKEMSGEVVCVKI